MFKERLKEFILSTFPEAKVVSGGREINCRCRLCGDSADPKKKHFYIGLGADDEPSFFDCKKCGESGMLSAKILRKLSIYNDGGMNLELESFNRDIMKLPKNRIMKNRMTYQIYNNYISESPLSDAKLIYINKRLGQDLTFKDLMENKIVINIYDLLTANNVQKCTRYENVMHDLNESFIGFVSMDNAFVNMRNLRPGKVCKYVDFRYVNYNIFEKVDNSKRCYVIPSECNFLDPTPIKIHIGEGAFDILSVFFNLREQNRYQNIYTSIGGKAYLNIIKLFIQDLGIINCEFHIYIDNDIDDYTIYNITDIILPLGIPLYLHRNMCIGEKDFGVPINRIIEQITKL